jgi:hypothetical protein
MPPIKQRTNNVASGELFLASTGQAFVAGGFNTMTTMRALFRRRHFDVSGCSFSEIVDTLTSVAC